MFLPKKILNILPKEVIDLIYEFDNSYKHIHTRVIKQLKYILRSYLIYDISVAFDFNVCDIDILDYDIIDTEIQWYKSQRKKIGCECNKPCCYQFSYIGKKYICGCCKKINRSYGYIGYTRYVDRFNKITTLTSDNGFCSKIISLNQYF